MDFKFVMFDNDTDDTDDTGPAIGDIVSLASGGELMTVEGFCDCGSVDVVWFSGNDDDGWTLNRDSFDVDMLVCMDGE